MDQTTSAGQSSSNEIQKASPVKSGHKESQKTSSVQSGHQRAEQAAATGEKSLTVNLPTESCPICNKVVYRRCLQDHMNLHTGEKPWACKICDKTFRVKKSLRDHVRIHTGEKPFECGFCQKRFTHKTGLKNHKYVHTKIKKFACELCDKSFSWKTSLQSHLVTHKKKKSHQSKYQHQCRSCGKGFVDPDCLKKHEQIHEENEIFPCKKCEKTFTSNQYLKRHIQTVHDVAVSMQPKEKFNKHLQNADKGHSENSGDEESGKSEKKTTKDDKESKNEPRKKKTKIDLTAFMKYTGPDPKMHMKTKARGPGKPLRIAHESTVCDVCGMAFKDKSSLKDHLYKHRDPSELPFSCDFCGKGFVKRAYMQEHRVVHTGEKNHVCSYCGKRYATRKSVRDHIRTHTGEKPYKCEICHETFAFRSTYVYHWSTHMDKRLFVCAICDKDFSWAYTYKVHMRSVHQLTETDIEETMKISNVSGGHYRNVFKQATPPKHKLKGPPSPAAKEKRNKKPEQTSAEDLSMPNTVPKTMPRLERIDEAMASLAAKRNKDKLSLPVTTMDNRMFRAFGSQPDGKKQQTHNAVDGCNFGYIENILPPYNNQLPGVQSDLEADFYVKHEPIEAGDPVRDNSLPPPHQKSTKKLPDEPGKFLPTTPSLAVPATAISTVKENLPELREDVQWLEAQEQPANLEGPEAGVGEKLDIKPELDISTASKVNLQEKVLPSCGNDVSAEEGLLPPGGNASDHDGDDNSERTVDYNPGEHQIESDAEDREHSGEESDQTESYTVESDTSEDKGSDNIRREKTRKNSIQCDRCQAWFVSSQNLARHQKRHEGESNKAFNCATCNGKFKSKKELRKHGLVHASGTGRYTCKECGKGFNKRGSLRDHMVVHYDAPTHKCKYCGKLFRHRRTRQEHERLEHIQTKDYVCEICGDAFVIPRQLRIHKRKHVDKNSLVCVECDLRFKRKYCLEQHKKLHHIGEKSHGCDTCNIQGQTPFWAECHQATHAEESRFMCEICGSLQDSQANLANHMSMEHKGDRLKCPQCNRTFKSKYTLADHVKCVHDEQYNFMCEICGKKMVSKHTFDRHMMIHNDIVPFFCKSCDKGFRLKLTYDRHMKSRSHELRVGSYSPLFTCEICNKFFGKRELLMKHCKSTRHKLLCGEQAHKAYHCLVCQCSFLTERNLKTHFETRKHAENVSGMASC